MPNPHQRKPEQPTSPENTGETTEQISPVAPSNNAPQQTNTPPTNRYLFSLVGILLVVGMIGVQLMIYLEVRNEGTYYQKSDKPTDFQVVVEESPSITLKWQPVNNAVGYLVLRSEPSDTPLTPPTTTALTHDTFRTPYTPPRPASHLVDGEESISEGEEAIPDLDDVSEVTTPRAITPYVLSNSDGSLINIPEFVDHSVEPGQYFIYRVISFDTNGNAIAASRFFTAGIPLEEGE